MFANIIIILFLQLVSIKSPYLFSKIKKPAFLHRLFVQYENTKKKCEKLVNI